MHRFVWDLHYPEPPAVNHDYPISAIPHDTPRIPQGPLARPGRYTVTLTVDGKTLTQPLEVRLDPRVRMTAAALEEQFALAQRIVRDMAATDSKKTADLNDGFAALLDVVEAADAPPTEQAVQQLEALERQIPKR
jgi:hypothetical protein